MDIYDIKQYETQLLQICAVCKHARRCKDKTKMCLAKKLVFNIAKHKHKKQEREKVSVNQ